MQTIKSFSDEEHNFELSTELFFAQDLPSLQTMLCGAEFRYPIYPLFIFLGVGEDER